MTRVAAILLVMSGAGEASPPVHAAPIVPAPPSVAAVDTPARAGSLDVSWAGSVDATGGYLVEHASATGEFTQTSVGMTTAHRINGLARGVTWRVRIRAVDAATGPSEPSGEVALRLPPLAARLMVRLQVAGGAVRACAGARAACVVETTRAGHLQLRASAPLELAGSRVELEIRHRQPGTRRFRTVGHRRFRLAAADVGAGAPLAAVVHHSGTWCTAVRLVDADDVVLAAEPPTCIRFRPPVEIGWAGDIVVGSRYGLPPNGGRNQFDHVARLLGAPDLMIGNYEGTLSRGGTPRCVEGAALCYLFQAPPERARNLRDAGFDVMNLANNHGLDYGEDSRRQTIRALARVGVGAAGLPGRVTIVQVEDTRVGIVGMSPYAGTTSMRSPDAVRSLVREARRRADIVVMCMHVGLEGPAGAHVPRGADYGTRTRAAARAAIDAGADVVFGSGPHVVRGVERWRGRYVVYSAGNFAGWRNFGGGGLLSQSGIVRMTFDHRGRPAAAAWDPVVLRGPGIPHPDRTGVVIRRVAALSRADFGRRAPRFERDGRFR